MTTALQYPPTSQKAKATLPPARWTVEQFHRMNSPEIIGPERRLMLIDGQILEREPMNPPHALTVELMTAVLYRTFGSGWRIRVQLPLELSLYLDPFPDFAILKGNAKGETVHPTNASLVIEVADTSLDFDLTEKAELYATANIPEYWVLDLNARTLVVLRDPVPVPDNRNAYRSITTLKIGDHIQPLAKPEATIAIADLLP